MPLNVVDVMVFRFSTAVEPFEDGGQRQNQPLFLDRVSRTKRRCCVNRSS